MLSQFKNLFRQLSRKERLFLSIAVSITIISGTLLGLNYFKQNTVSRPIAGGEYTEGIMGQPTFINPVLMSANEADKILISIVFDNLMDLAESYKVNPEGREWTIRLKESAAWHDEQPITSDDVIFTIETIQNPDNQSPLFPNWQGVSVKRVSEREIKINLPAPYAFFDSTLKDLRPIPKHLFQDIPAANFRLSNYNLEPIGSGPFKYVSFQKQYSGFIDEYRFSRNENYFNQKPYLDKLIFKFYPGPEELKQTFQSGAVDGFGDIGPQILSGINIPHQTFKAPMARYYAVFFNPYSHPALEDKDIRTALDYAIDKKAIISNVLGGQAMDAKGPLTAGVQGYNVEIYSVNQNISQEKTKELLENNGWKMNSEGTREMTVQKTSQKGKKKETEIIRLEFTLVVPQAPSFLGEAAKLIQEDWAKIGVKLNLNIMPIANINEEIIKTRNYQMLLFGNIFSSEDNPDLFSFWHSSERFYPGLNLALYENKKADILIESIRRNLNFEKRQKDLSDLQEVIIDDVPAAFLFSPFYLYIASPQLKGFEPNIISQPSDRFKDAEKWYT